MEVKGLATEVVAAVDAICTKLEVPASKLFAICAKQACVSAVFDSICFIVCSLVTINMFFFMKKAIKTCKKDDYDCEYLGLPMPIVLLVSGAIFALFLAFSCVSLGCALTGFINPEYKALEIIADLIKPKAS